MNTNQIKDYKKKYINNVNLKNFVSYADKIINSYAINEYKNVNFVRSDNTSQVMTLFCISKFLKNENLTIEKLINIVPQSMASRSHAINVVNDLCKKNILFKETHSEDKRSKLIYPSKSILEEYNQFYLYKAKTLNIE